MKLFINSGSPFARKVRILVREKGLLGGVEEVFTVPVESQPDLVAANPLCQIPALIDDDGISWTDSRLICAWLTRDEGRHDDWATRRLEVLADGILEMTVKMVLENRRPENERSAFWLKRWQDNMVRAFAVAERVCPAVDGFDAGSFDVGAMTLAIAATYADFRYPDIDWRADAPRVAALQAALEKRPSFIDTYPK